MFNGFVCIRPRFESGATGQSANSHQGGRILDQMSRERSTSIRYAVLLSGSGRTLENLLRAIDRDELEGAVVAVVSSRTGVRGIEVAGRAGIPAAVIERREFDGEGAFSDAIYAALAPYEPHLILLAGFLRKLYVTAP